MMISIVIPSYNSEQTIRGCIDSLLGQRPVEDHEIILVDSSSDRTPEIVVEAYPMVRLTHLPQRTDPGEARNRGIEESRGEIVAFIDSDCQAAPGWLEGIRAAHQAGHRIVGGAIECANPRSEPVAWAGYLAEFRQFIPEQPRRLVDHVPTANISYRRSILDTFGQFQGVNYPQEDLVFNLALQRGGERILFDPAIRVRHRHRPALAGFLRHQRLIGGATATVLRDHGGAGSFIARRPLLALLAFPFLPLVKFFKTAAVFIRYRRGSALRPLLAWAFLALGLGWWSWGFLKAALTGRPNWRR